MFWKKRDEPKSFPDHQTNSHMGVRERGINTRDMPNVTFYCCLSDSYKLTYELYVNKKDKLEKSWIFEPWTMRQGFERSCYSRKFPRLFFEIYPTRRMKSLPIRVGHPQFR
tara:strand:- start:82 stop:414 length:333 start_codon:yes stop_codon:yes gene_type:complete